MLKQNPGGSRADSDSGFETVGAFLYCPIGKGTRLLMLCFPHGRAVVEVYRVGGHLAMKGATHDGQCVSILMLGSAEHQLFSY